MQTLSLCGQWTLKNVSKNKEYCAFVPGLNILELIKSGDISDIYKSGDEKSIHFVGEDEWEYTKEFQVSKEETENEHIFLFFERLDTLATVSLNGEVIAKTQNIHRTYSFDVKNQLHVGINILSVKFASLRSYIRERQKENLLPFNAMGTTGHPHIRKCACHFGWDFAPELVMQGISGKCELRFISSPQIKNLFVYQQTDSALSVVSVKTDIFNFQDGTLCEYTLISPDGKVQTQAVSSENETIHFEVQNPQLWWCNGLGEQPLYTVRLTLKKGETVLDFSEKKIGLRTIRLNRENGDFHFYINSVPIFAKGSNYIPMDSLYTRITHERLYALLSECKKANMNMIRVWGGGFYESDDFYSICDELGLLVWQDFAFACCAYPFMEKDFLENVKEEVKENVCRIMHHASLALWCGNNEIESISMAWMHRTDFIKSTGDFFYKTLPELIRLYDNTTPYHQCSPGSGKYMKLVNSDKAGDTHIWNVWHGFQSKNYFKKRFTKFCSEFGMQSYPGKNTAIHQKCDLGEERLEYYLTKHFTIPKDATEKRYLTQLLQLESMKEAVEHFRRNMHRCHGALFWQLNDCWDVVSWSAIDFNKNRKALMFGAKDFFEPVHVSAEKKHGFVKVHVSSDSNEIFNGKLKIFDASTTEQEKLLIERDFSLCACSSKEIVSLKVKSPKTHLLVLRLYSSDGKLISENRFAQTDNKNLKLVSPQLKIETFVKSGKLYANVKSDSYARYVMLESESSRDFSENFFDLSTSESKNVEIKGASLSEEVSAISLYDCLEHRNKVQDFALCLKNALLPMSIANRVSRWFDK